MLIVQLDLEIKTVPWESRERDLLQAWRRIHVLRYLEMKHHERKVRQKKGGVSGSR